MISYFIRVHCRWVRVTTSYAVWAAIPRAVIVVGGCGMVAGAIGVGLRALPVAPPSAVVQAHANHSHVYEVPSPNIIPDFGELGGPVLNSGVIEPLSMAESPPLSEASPAAAEGYGGGLSPPTVGPIPVVEVPEPTSLGLLAAAVVALVVVARRRS